VKLIIKYLKRNST